MMVVLILAGALIWFRPYLTQARQAVSEIPGPAPMSAFSSFSVPPRGHACMSTVGINPTSHIAEFSLRPAKASPAGGPPVRVTLSAPGYNTSVEIPRGYPGGNAVLPIDPPKQAVIGTACFTNLGKMPVLLNGTTEPRTISRSTVKINGRPTVGDIDLMFSDERPNSIFNRLDEVFAHASNLTDRLIPPWFIWMFAVIVSFGVTAGIVLAFYQSLVEQENTIELDP